jgi:hypothetical protein
MVEGTQALSVAVIAAQETARSCRAFSLPRRQSPGGGSEVAEQRDAGIVAPAKTIAWDDMRGYLEKRMAGEPAKRPTARKLAR